MTNVKYLKEHGLYDAHKKFVRIAESYVSAPFVVNEADGDDDQDPNAMGGPGGPDAMGGDPNGMGGAPGGMGGDPNAMGGPGGPDAMGGDPNAMGGAPGDMGGDPNAMGGPGGPDAMGGDPNAMGGPEGPDTMGDDPMGGDPMGEDPMMGDDGEEEEGIIDIEDLTDASDKTYSKQNQLGRDLAKVDSKIGNLIDMISKLQSALDSNNSEIERLKGEFEKRNPTQTEKLNLRSLDSYPFNVKPTDYWAEKERQGGYSAYADNSEPTSKEYTITNSDVDDIDNDVANTFFTIDDDDIQTMDKLFRF